MGRIYAAAFEEVAVTVAQDLFEVVASADAAVVVSVGPIIRAVEEMIPQPDGIEQLGPEIDGVEQLTPNIKSAEEV
jgi:hypothetical protein